MMRSPNEATGPKQQHRSISRLDRRGRARGIANADHDAFEEANNSARQRPPQNDPRHARITTTTNGGRG